MATIRGGEKLLAKLAELSSQVSKPGTLKVGFLSGAAYPDGTPVAAIAAIQNYGAPAAGIPPRPFFSNMIRAKSPTWGDGVAKALKAADYDATKALEVVGEAIEGQLRQSIRDTNDPALAPSTVKRKGFAKPLIDTGHMIASVDHEVT